MTYVQEKQFYRSSSSEIINCKPSYFNKFSTPKRATLVSYSCFEWL